MLLMDDENGKFITVKGGEAEGNRPAQQRYFQGEKSLSKRSQPGTALAAVDSLGGWGGGFWWGF